MVVTAHEFVGDYLAAHEGSTPRLDRVVSVPSGLDAAGMVQALADPRLAEPGRQPLALHMMCDFMAPEGSLYFDAIYGDFRGQAAIRNWLVPTMATIDFIEFVPTQPHVLFDDGLGGTSLDEWQMVAAIGDERMPLSRGVSVRRYRDGWITWACDVYDTGPFRAPPPPEMVDAVGPEAQAAPLPDWPRTKWEPDLAVSASTSDLVAGDAAAAARPSRAGRGRRCRVGHHPRRRHALPLAVTGQ